MQLKGMIAMITGGGQGIGRAIAESLLAQGVKVVICDIDTNAGEATVTELAKRFGASFISFMPLDVTNAIQYEDCIKRIVERMGGIDILVNNAGICDETEEAWERMVLVNFSGVVRGSKLGMKYMSKVHGGRGGWIINMGSITSEFPFPLIPVYAAAKAGVSHITRSYGHPLYSVKSGVKVICINPGVTKTNMANSANLSWSDPDIEAEFSVWRSENTSQSASSLARGLLDVLEKAESGTVWTIKNDQPPTLCLNPA